MSESVPVTLMTGTGTEVIATVRDQGLGFDVAALTLPDNRVDAFEPTRGRGLVLTGVFMDEVSYNDAGNEVTLVKRVPPTDRGVVR